MNLQTKSFIMGFLAGVVVMMAIVLIWNVTSPAKEVNNVTINKTPTINPLIEEFNKPHENPFKDITAPKITKFAGGVLRIMLIIFVLFYIFFACNSEKR